MHLHKNVFQLHYDNSLDAFVPEMWAMESVAILVENMVAANLVHRDFQPMFASHGDVVNTRKPAEFTAKRKTNTDNVTIQDASATNIPVPLDQHVHTSFLIRDGEESKSFKSLVEEYLFPATLSLARFVDQMVLAQYAQFMANQAGSLGGLTSSNAVEYITDVGLVMDVNKAHQVGRQQIWTPHAQALIIQNATFHQADRVGDDGTALRTASIGEKLNFRHWMAQNMSQLTLTSTPDETGAIDLAAGYPVGATTIHVDGLTVSQSPAVTKGQWLSVNGKVYQVAADADSDAAGDADVTLVYGLKEAVADNDVVDFWPAGNLVDLAAGYAAGYSKQIAIDDGAGAVASTIQVGQMISFHADVSNRYVVIDVEVGATETLLTLDRPLAAAISDNNRVNYAPEGGGYNFAFHRNALTLAVRPLAPPRQGTGAVAGLADMAGATMRVVITYDGNKQGHLVTLDFLAGIKVLDINLGAVALS